MGLNKAVKWASEEGLNLHTICDDLKNHPTGENKWDGIINIFAHTYPEVRKTIHSRIEKALKPGGVFILEVYTKVNEIAHSIRNNPRPVLIEFKTFRMRGHEEASGTKYVPKELIESWAEKDPVVNFQNYLKSKNILTEDLDTKIKEEINFEINHNLKISLAENKIEFNLFNELNDVYKQIDIQHVSPKNKKSNILSKICLGMETPCIETNLNV